MTDWNELTIDSTFEDVIGMINEQNKKIAKMDYTGDTNVPEGAVQLSLGNARIERWTGQSWDQPFERWNMYVTYSTDAFNLDGKPGWHYLDCANFTGTLSSTHVPYLDTSKISTGTFHVDRIPKLPASKITSGKLPHAQLDMWSIVADVIFKKAIEDHINLRFGGTGTTLTVDKHR